MLFVLNQALIDYVEERILSDKYYALRWKIQLSDVKNIQTPQLDSILSLVKKYPKWLEAVAKDAIHRMDNIPMQDRITAIEELIAILKPENPNK